MERSNWQIWCNSLQLSKPYWDAYARVMPTHLDRPAEQQPKSHQVQDNHTEEQEQRQVQVEAEEEPLKKEYLEFIKVTRQHQTAREKAKKLELLKNPHLNCDIYYKDISQVQTLIEDNVVEPPQRHDTGLSQEQLKEQRLVQLYGGREQYERIRSLEMSIDVHFKNQCRELDPPYWPAIPINMKPYFGNN